MRYLPLTLLAASVLLVAGRWPTTPADPPWLPAPLAGVAWDTVVTRATGDTRYYLLSDYQNHLAEVVVQADTATVWRYRSHVGEGRHLIMDVTLEEPLDLRRPIGDVPTGDYRTFRRRVLAAHSAGATLALLRQLLRVTVPNPAPGMPSVEYLPDTLRQLADWELVHSYRGERWGYLFAVDLARGSFAEVGLDDDNQPTVYFARTDSMAWVGGDFFETVPDRGIDVSRPYLEVLPVPDAEHLALSVESTLQILAHLRSQITWPN